MSSEIKYPYIGEGDISGAVMLFTSDGEAMTIDAGQSNYESKESDLSEDFFKNITHEYLQNTWGVVESKEHAEFIIELAELHGLEIFNEFDFGITHFAINKGEVIFTYGAPSVSDHDKQITIPLSPKVKATPESQEDFNCRCEFVDVETWPSLGDRVTVYGQQGNVILTTDKNGFYIIDADGLYLAAKVTDITKPKSKEDLLIEELQTKLCENNYVDNYTLANDIVNGMIEGLSYEPK